MIQPGDIIAAARVNGVEEEQYLVVYKSRWSEPEQDTAVSAVDRDGRYTTVWFKLKQARIIPIADPSTDPEKYLNEVQLYMYEYLSGRGE